MFGGMPIARSVNSAIRLAKGRDGPIAYWASRMPSDLNVRAEAAGIPLWTIEDGFIRSTGLGAALIQPCSIVLDSRAPHYDSSRPTDLEVLLQTRTFTSVELTRAERLISRLSQGGFTKYNLAGSLPELPQDRRIVLVLGQVDDDLSVTLGGCGETVSGMVAHVRRVEPDAFIVFKPHPDAVAGLRKGLLAPDVDAILADASLTALFERVDSVHALTSLGGFEALLRGCKVVVHGQPFYSGWGLTRDLRPQPRRTRQLTLTELVAGALIEYPIYFHPLMQQNCTVEELLDHMEKIGPAAVPGTLARWAGQAANRLGSIWPRLESRNGIHERTAAMQQSPIYDIWRILDRPSHEPEAEIRALCQTAYLGKHEALCRILGRYKIYVDTRDVGIASHLMLEGYWEMWVTAAMMRCVRRGSVVADVGANLGYFTLLLADLTGAEGRVLSFEPNPNLTRLLRKSIDVNGFGGFTKLHPMALGACEGTSAMDIKIEQPGGGRMLGGESGSNSSDHIRVGRFDEIEHALDVEFIKMDVEGFEPQVWAGMTRILEQRRPLTIFMEFTVGRLPDPAGFLDQILSLGFSLELISFNQGIVSVTREQILGGPLDVDHMLVFRR
jgi:FkbM family methyltransferase